MKFSKNLTTKEITPKTQKKQKLKKFKKKLCKETSNQKWSEKQIIVRIEKY